MSILEIFVYGWSGLFMAGLIAGTLYWFLRSKRAIDTLEVLLRPRDPQQGKRINRNNRPHD